MERLAILDHANHELYIEDVDEEIIEMCGGEQEYIEANYEFEEGYSWDYIVGVSYYPEGSEVPHDIDIDALVKD